MIVMDNENPDGVSIGPASVVPKRLAAALGAEARIKRSMNKEAAIIRSRRVERRNQNV